jgi:hypothetical protein
VNSLRKLLDDEREQTKLLYAKIQIEQQQNGYILPPPYEI